MSSGASRKRILVVDDHSEVRQLLAYTLDAKDFLVFQANNGREAIKLARAKRPDLVLLDLSMPEMGGLEVCRILKADPETAGAKVIVLTGTGSLQIEDQARALGADGFFSKPFSPVALLNKVYEALG